jgi:hypothetical protein
MANMNAAMDHRIAQEVATHKNAWFTKDQIVRKVVASYGKLPTAKGLDVPAILTAYVNGRVSRFLREKDVNGFRTYESYPALGQWRWQRARGLDAPTLLRVIDERRVQLNRDAQALARLERLYTALIAYQASTGKANATVDDVIDSVA